ncbi:MAG: hypothetical protein ACI8QS_001630 [Planctomycetota bacterium]|jgi:hypothetical protein
MSKRTRNLYVWKTLTDDGQKRQVQAQLFGSQWKFSSRIGDEEEWTDHEDPDLEDLEDLEEMIFNKYQRKHAAWDHLNGVRMLIVAKKGE